jgi:hypothetical protein
LLGRVVGDPPWTSPERQGRVVMDDELVVPGDVKVELHEVRTQTPYGMKVRDRIVFCAVRPAAVCDP